MIIDILQNKSMQELWILKSTVDALLHEVAPGDDETPTVKEFIVYSFVLDLDIAINKQIEAQVEPLSPFVED